MYIPERRVPMAMAPIVLLEPLPLLIVTIHNENTQVIDNVQNNKYLSHVNISIMYKYMYIIILNSHVCFNIMRHNMNDNYKSYEYKCNNRCTQDNISTCSMYSTTSHIIKYNTVHVSIKLLL